MQVRNLTIFILNNIHLLYNTLSTSQILNLTMVNIDLIAKNEAHSQIVNFQLS